MTSSDNEISEDEWISKSRKGDLCGVLGCTHPPTSQCSKCMNHYCSGHLDLHVHKATDEEKGTKIRKDEALMDWAVALENPTLNTTECCQVCSVVESIARAEKGLGVTGL